MVPGKLLHRFHRGGLGGAEATGIQTEKQHTYVLRASSRNRTQKTLENRRLPSNRRKRPARFSKALARIRRRGSRGSSLLSAWPPDVRRHPGYFHESHSHG